MILALVLFLHNYCVSQSAPPIGQWREHLPYNNAWSLEFLQNKLWTATPYSLFSLDPSDNSIERLSRVNGLTETGIRTIGKDAGGTRLVVIYNSGNIDIVDHADIFNIPDIASSRLIIDKTINQVFAYGTDTWLAGNEAIYALNTEKNEIRDTYIIGSNGSKTKISSLAVFKNNLYAATDQGIRYAPLSSSNLPDFRSWKSDTATGLPRGPVAEVLAFNDLIIGRIRDSLFVSNGAGWSFLYRDGWRMNSIRTAGERIAIQENLNGAARIVVISKTGAAETIIQNQLIKAPSESLLVGSTWWIADSLAGLSAVSGTSPTGYNPESPLAVTGGTIEAASQKILVAGGNLNFGWMPSGTPGYLGVFENNRWTNFSAANLPALNQLPDLLAAVTDPSDQSVWAGSYGGGLMHLKKDYSAEIFKQGSFINPTYFSASSYRVSGLRFDIDRNLWIANYGANQNLVVRKTDGSARSFQIPFPLSENAVSDIIIDELNQKWIISPGNNGLICFNHGASIDNPGDDGWKWYRTGAGNGNLPDNNVLSIVKDKDGFIWVGTARGIGIIRCTQEVFSAASCDAVLPVVQQDNFAGYLFRDEQVQAIAVDGANRKWIGTKNGLWLISADGEKIIYRLATSNSPLLADDVRKLAIDPLSGEVFIATASGLCSFRSTATEGSQKSENLLVFPNPVPPGYTGTIAIRGAAENAIVKITELNGNLVYQARALGGQAIWNGKDYQGRQISSGIYLVLISDNEKKDQVATKIVYIKK